MTIYVHVLFLAYNYNCIWRECELSFGNAIIAKLPTIVVFVLFLYFIAFSKL